MKFLMFQPFLAVFVGNCGKTTLILNANVALMVIVMQKWMAFSPIFYDPKDLESYFCALASFLEHYIFIYPISKNGEAVRQISKIENR